MEISTKFFHALHVLLCDPKLELHLYIGQGASQPSFKVMAADKDHLKVMFLNQSAGYLVLPDKACATIHEVTAWLEKLVPVAISSKGFLSKVVDYRDESFSYSNICAIPLWS